MDTSSVQIMPVVFHVLKNPDIEKGLPEKA
jgi:hypothetical protein